MTTILLAAGLLGLAYAIVAFLNRRDPHYLDDTRERREMQVRADRSRAWD